MRRRDDGSAAPNPEAEIERAKRLIAEGLTVFVSAHLAKEVAGSEWVDQRSSPLGRRRHCALVRAGKLPGARDGRRILVRKQDIDAYLREHEVVRVDANVDEEREIERVLAVMRKKGRAT